MHSDSLSAYAGDMDMPSGSTLPQPQDSSDMPGAPSFGGTASASVPMEDQAGVGPRFRAGSRVLYDSEGIPVKGTVAKSSGIGEPSGPKNNMLVVSFYVAKGFVH